MPTLINGLTLQEAVTRDGLPRQATADDSTQHVLYLPPGLSIAHSMEAAEWVATRGSLPTEPTPAEIAAAIAAREAEAAQTSNDLTLLRMRVLDIAKSAVGVHIDALSTPQLLALFKVVLWESGAFDRSGQVRPLRDWVNR